MNNRQTRNGKRRASSHLLLFQQPASPPKNIRYQEIYEMVIKKYEKAAKTCLRKVIPQKQQAKPETNRNRELQNRKYAILCSRNIKPTSKDKNKPINASVEEKRRRTLSSNKLERGSRKAHPRRNKNFAKNLRQYMKMNEYASSNSKKTTDNSNSSEIQRMKNENERICEQIKNEEKMIQRIEREIDEEERVHESARQLYNFNILKLRNKVCWQEDFPLKMIRELEQSCIFSVEQHSDFEDYDCLSIESK